MWKRWEGSGWLSCGSRVGGSDVSRGGLKSREQQVCPVPAAVVGWGCRPPENSHTSQGKHPVESSFAAPYAESCS